jgi:hypothetical protein
MGNITIKLKDVAECKLKPDGAYGLFAKINLLPNTRIDCSEDIFIHPRFPEYEPNKGLELMNDGCFEYPENYEYKTLYNTFEKFISNNNHNLIPEDVNKGDILIITKQIQNGEELTRKYLIEQWWLWLMNDICDKNPFSARPKLNYSREQQLKYIDILCTVVSEFGYKTSTSDKIFRKGIMYPKINNSHLE